MLGRSLGRFPSTWMELTLRSTNIDQIHVLISQFNSWDSKTALIAFVTVFFIFCNFENGTSTTRFPWLNSITH